MALYTSILDLVGNTPLLELRGMTQGLDARVLVKLESYNPLSSVKDRIGLSIIEQAEKEGVLGPGATIVEATSGNTGIALAYIGAVKGYRVVLTMPETMSIERRRLLKTFGAELELTPGGEGMNGAVRRAREIVESTPGAFMARQFENQANPLVHRKTTAEEIWRDTQGQVDAFVSGVGTGGTLTGAGGRLRELNPEIRIVAVEPDSSPVLSGGSPGPHKIQGIGAGFVPQVLDTSLYDEVIQVSAVQAGETSRSLARVEGVLGGISAGANVWAALELAKRKEFAGKTIVTLICDTGERYLSTWLFE
ncbi:cysteine synthase A [Spirochaeta lutea]|uniref:cysteine synthase n=1 Tax=Spirochaeta lutea TaxID=1480694 RepID=A0A098QZX7_9SPIO|nr:cysteine synthase A [Spirochaeta lutea]KGE73425.1 cysteine synthase [Spirochaeta lutea]